MFKFINKWTTYMMKLTDPVLKSIDEIYDVQYEYFAA
jgi:hypothetical protein